MSKSINNLKRYKEIIRVFVKYGFNDLVNKISLAIQPQNNKDLLLTQRENANVLSSTRLRIAFEELGATFIKLGQMLSLHPDIIPAEFILEFSKLQDNVQKENIEEIKSVLNKEFGKPIDKIFLEFDESPIAAGSIAQVHKAKLKSGNVVAVKILRPDVGKKIESDLEILKDIAKLIAARIPESKIYDPVGIIKEFSKSIKKELDLAVEGHNIDTLRNYMQDDQTIKIPVVYWDYTSESILVTEFINGIKFSDIQSNKEYNIGRKQVTENLANLFLKQVFEMGIFHADPHPGNIFVLPDNVISLVDFGNVDRIDEDTCDSFIEILIGIVDKNPRRIARVINDISVVDEQINLRKLEIDLTEFLDHYYNVPLYRIVLSKLLNEFVELIRTYQIKLPPQIITMIRTLVILEAVTKGIYPQFNLAEILIPFTKNIYLNKLNPLTGLRSIIRTAEESFDSLKKLPEDLQSFLYKLRNDKFTITFKHNGLEEVSRIINSSSNGLSFAIIIAALIIGSSIIMYVGKGNLLWGYPVVGFCSFVIASILGVWLLIGIMRSGKL